MRAVAFALLLALSSARALAAEPGGALEELLQRLGGAIPYPPTRILETLHDQGIEPYGGAVLPHGRSLERRATDYKRPRSMVAYYFGPRNAAGRPTDPARFVFIAYTPAKDQLELIAGSETLPQGFFLVRDYHQGSAKPTRPAEGVGLCLACHHGGGPIFPIVPWSETQNAYETRAKLDAESDLDPFARRLLELTDARGEFLPGTGNHNRELVASFDDAVRIASHDEEGIPEAPADPLRPSSVLVNRFSIANERALGSGAGEDPLIPRPPTSANQAAAIAQDYSLRPSPAWRIPLGRDGSQPAPAGSTSALFTAYCASCHGGADPVAGGIGLDDPAKLRFFVGDTPSRTVVSLLERKIMPPIGARLPTPEERSRMVAPFHRMMDVSDPTRAAAARDHRSPFTSCLYCHDDELEAAAPYIPFRNPDEFARALAKPGYPRGTLVNEIRYRIHAQGADHMPKDGTLDAAEKAAIEAYLNSAR